MVPELMTLDEIDAAGAGLFDSRDLLSSDSSKVTAIRMAFGRWFEDIFKDIPECTQANGDFNERLWISRFPVEERAFVSVIWRGWC